MRVVQLATLLSLGAGSLSILIPSTTSLEASSIEIEINGVDGGPGPKTDGSLSPEALAIEALTQTLEIPCDSCPFYQGSKDSKKASAVYAQDPNVLVLTLSLDPLARDVINLNGAPLFPFVYTQSEPEPITVTQKSKESGEEVTVPVGLDLVIETDANNLSRLRLHVISVAGFKTQATMEILEFPVFQNEKGEIFIGEVHKRPPTSAEASSVMCKDDVLCRWKHYLYDAFQRVTGTGTHSGVRKGGCHGKGKHFKRPPHTVDSHEQPPHGHGNGKHHGGQHHHEGKMGLLGWAFVLIRLVIACLVIGAITVSIGLFATILLTSIFHVLLVAWWFITGRKRNLNVGDYEIVVNENDEEQGLITKDAESQLDVPEYSDELPVYAENEEKH